MDLPHGLIFVSDETPGCSRRRCGRGFAYFGPDGMLIRSPEERARFNALAVPPAYQQVWLCPDPRGYLQATGRDARGRKQYRYHDTFRAYRENRKFDRLGDFGRALPKIRRTVDRQLNRSEAGEMRYVLALVVKLLDQTGLRIGNESYLRSNGTRGLLTLSERHVEWTDAASRLQFDFTAKGGRAVSRWVANRRLVVRVRKLQELPGQRLFRYADAGGAFHDLTSEEVNAYLHEIAGDTFTAKDFRTWIGSREAAARLHEEAKDAVERDSGSIWRDAVKAAATALGNTEAMARKAYIHPALSTEEAQRFFAALDERPPAVPDRLSRIEAALIGFID